jgi:hypothetical protein
VAAHDFIVSPKVKETSLSCHSLSRMIQALVFGMLLILDFSVKIFR